MHALHPHLPRRRDPRRGGDNLVPNVEHAGQLRRRRVVLQRPAAADTPRVHDASEKTGQAAALTPSRRPGCSTGIACPKCRCARRGTPPSPPRAPQPPRAAAPLRPRCSRRRPPATPGRRRRVQRRLLCCQPSPAVSSWRVRTPAGRVQSHNAYRRERGRQLQPDIALAERLEAVTSFGGRDASHRGHQRHPPCLSHSSRLSRAQVGSLLLLRRRLLPTPSKLSRRFAILGLNAKRWASDGQRPSTADVRAASHDLAV